MKIKHFSSILNYIGLTTAFLAFLVIMIQIDYETSFCSSYRNRERTYRVERGSAVENDITSSGKYCCIFSRPYIEVLKDAPVIESYSRIMGGTDLSFFIYDTESRELPSVKGQGMIICNKQTLDMMNVKFILGQENAEKMNENFDNVFLSRDLAHKIYGDINPIGRRISYNNQFSSDSLYVGGVYEPLPNNGISNPEMIVPYGDFDLQQHGNQSTHLFVTIHEGITKEEAELSLYEYSKKYFVSMGDKEENAVLIRLTPIDDIHFTTDVEYQMVDLGNRSTLYSLISIAIILILVAMVNFWNIAMACVPSRIKNINIRRVLGVSREKLIGVQMMQTVLIALAAFVSALLFLYLLKDSTIASFISVDINPLPHWKLICTTGVFAILISSLAGLSPAIYSTSFAPAMVLKGGFAHNVKGRNLRNTLIGFQFIVSLILGIFALFVNIQNDYMQSFNKGFKSGDVLYSVLDNKLAYVHRQLAERLKKHPEIEDVTFSSRDFVSMGGISMGWGRNIDGKGVSFKCLPVERNFIEFFDISITDGRHFEMRDESAKNAHFVLNKAAATQYELKVGTIFGGYDADDEIIGFCENFFCRPLQYSVEPAALVFSSYFMGNESWETMNHCYIKRAHGIGLNEVSDILKTEILNISSDVHLETISLDYFDETIGKLYDKEKQLSTLTFSACILSVLIAIIGILGLVYFETQHRRKEIAIRRVMGAETTTLLSMFNNTYLRICLISFVIAAPIALLSIRIWVSGYAYQADIPMWIFIAALVVLVLIVVSAITFSSLKSIHRNPLESIKSE